MIESGEGDNPLILIEGPKDEDIPEDEKVETHEKDPPQSSELNRNSSPSMLSVTGYNNHTYRRSSSIASALSNLNFNSNRRGTLMFFFITWVAFILGLMIGGFCTNMFLCESTGQTNHTRQQFW